MATIESSQLAHACPPLDLGVKCLGIPFAAQDPRTVLAMRIAPSVIYVARQLGHGAELTMRVYGHVIEELEDRPQLPAEVAIQEARQAARERSSAQAISI